MKKISRKKSFLRSVLLASAAFSSMISSSAMADGLSFGVEGHASRLFSFETSHAPTIMLFDSEMTANDAGTEMKTINPIVSKELEKEKATFTTSGYFMASAGYKMSMVEVSLGAGIDMGSTITTGIKADQKVTIKGISVNSSEMNQKATDQEYKTVANTDGFKVTTALGGIGQLAAKLSFDVTNDISLNLGAALIGRYQKTTFEQKVQLEAVTTATSLFTRTLTETYKDEKESQFELSFRGFAGAGINVADGVRIEGIVGLNFDPARTYNSKEVTVVSSVEGKVTEAGATKGKADAAGNTELSKTNRLIKSSTPVTPATTPATFTNVAYDKDAAITIANKTPDADPKTKAAKDQKLESSMYLTAGVAIKVDL